MHQRSSQRSSNHLASLSQASWSSTSTLSSPWLDRPAKRQVAAAEIADDGVVGIGPEQQVELGVKRVAQEQLDDHLAGPDLGGQPAQAGLVFVGGSADRELVAELLGQLLLEAEGRLVVDAVVALTRLSATRSSSCGSRCMPTSSRQQCPSPPAQRSTQLVELLPAAQVEVADAEVGAVGELQGLPQGRQERLLDVVEDAGHVARLFWTTSSDMYESYRLATIEAIGKPAPTQAGPAWRNSERAAPRVEQMKRCARPFC